MSRSICRGDHRGRAAFSVLRMGRLRQSIQRRAAADLDIQSVSEPESDLQAIPQAIVQSSIRGGCGTRWYVAVCATVLSIVSPPPCSRLTTRSCGCLSAAAQWVGWLIFMSYLVRRPILFIPCDGGVFNTTACFDSPMALFLTSPPHPESRFSSRPAAYGLISDHPVRSNWKRAR